jgi:myosin heavy subunit
MNFQSDFQEITSAFTTMGIDSEEQLHIYRILSAVLLLGNIKFDGTTYSDTNPCSIDSSVQESWKSIAELLQINKNSFENAMVCVTRKIGSSII